MYAGVFFQTIFGSFSMPPSVCMQINTTAVSTRSTLIAQHLLFTSVVVYFVDFVRYDSDDRNITHVKLFLGHTANSKNPHTSLECIALLHYLNKNAFPHERNIFLNKK